MRAQEVEQMAVEIREWLIDKGLWIDVRMYYNGKVYYGENFGIEEQANPKDYFDYVAEPHILSMSFEGALYEVFNGTSARSTKLCAEFQEILEKYQVYYELGNAWNLTCYPE